MNHPHSSWPARHWAGVSARDFAAAQHSGLAAATVAVLPVAATEQHGPHLPLSVDSTLLQGVIDAALPLLPAALPVLFFPPQSVQDAPGALAFWAGACLLLTYTAYSALSVSHQSWGAMLGGSEAKRSRIVAWRAASAFSTAFWNL